MINSDSRLFNQYVIFEDHLTVYNDIYELFFASKFQESFMIRISSEWDVGWVFKKKTLS